MRNLLLFAAFCLLAAEDVSGVSDGMERRVMLAPHQGYGQTQLKCVMKDVNASGVIVSMWQRNIIDVVSVDVVNYALSDGIAVELYAFLCGECMDYSAKATMARILPFLTENKLKSFKIWWVVTALNGSWGANATKNAGYLADVLREAQQNGLVSGIYSNADEWGQAIGAAWIDGFAGFSLFYGHADSTQSFDDWATVSFGKWEKPQRKGYKFQYLCGNYFFLACQPVNSTGELGQGLRPGNCGMDISCKI